ncbi:MAG: glycosyltransferase [Verrucomicrobiota bacterium]|nr:glycosyltransferase [Verrucomicrobiota bacterium]
MKTILNDISKSDLHVHSKYSNRPKQWFLRRIGAPESFSEPLDIYKCCKEAGMDYVTITDHNTIKGSLDIAHLPNTFISSILTTYFPENKCKIYCIVSGINEDEFTSLLQHRENIYDLREYIHSNNIAHSIAHPLYQINNRLTVNLFEKLLVLFNSFQGINGARNKRACDISNIILKNLSNEQIVKLADKHNIKPFGSEPWNKRFTGGSDDIGGLYAGGAYTTTPKAHTVNDFVTFLKQGEHKFGGESGTSIRFATSMYRVGYYYYREHFISSGSEDKSLIGNFLKTLSQNPNKKIKPKVKLREQFKSTIRKNLQKFYIKTRFNPIEQMIVTEVSKIIDETDNQNVAAESHFKTACRISQELSFAFLRKGIFEIRDGKLINSLQAISSMGPMILGITPYLSAFSSQHRDEKFLQEVCNSFSSAQGLIKKSGKKVWVTDTLHEVNGVTKTIKTLASLANNNDISITVLTCSDKSLPTDFPLKNFKPVGIFKLPEYESLSISYPPFMEILAYLEEQKFDEVIISTPGPLGLCALGAAHLLGLNITGIYHTDFPKFLSDITEDERLGDSIWRFMKWFYSKTDKILVPTHYYKKILVDGGMDENIIDIMPRGIKRENFDPSFRNNKFWRKYNLEDQFTFLYVGRVSREKNIEFLLQTFLLLKKDGIQANLVIVGDGPLKADIEKKFIFENVVFTGYLHGKELSTAYASADCFVFPSMTDTFGNVILEAHASGLPAIVSNQGGPQEIVQSHESGLVVDMSNKNDLFNAMKLVINDPLLFKKIQKSACEKALSCQWEKALEKLQ